MFLNLQDQLWGKTMAKWGKTEETTLALYTAVPDFNDLVPPQFDINIPTVEKQGYRVAYNVSPQRPFIAFQNGVAHMRTHPVSLTLV